MLWGFGDITPRLATGIQPVPDPLPNLPTYGPVMAGLSGLGQDDTSDTSIPGYTVATVNSFNAPIPGNVNIGPVPGFAIPTTVSTSNTDAATIQNLQTGIAYRDALLQQGAPFGYSPSTGNLTITPLVRLGIAILGMSLIATSGGRR